MIPESEYVFTRRKRHFYHCENAGILNTRDRRDFSISIILLYSSKNANHAATIVMTIQPLTRTKFSKHSRGTKLYRVSKDVLRFKAPRKHRIWLFPLCFLNDCSPFSGYSLHWGKYFLCDWKHLLESKDDYWGWLCAAGAPKNEVFRVQSKDFGTLRQGGGVGWGGVFRSWRHKAFIREFLAA